MCDSIYCAYILVILCIVLYMFFYEANNKDDYYSLFALNQINVSLIQDEELYVIPLTSLTHWHFHSGGKVNWTVRHTNSTHCYTNSTNNYQCATCLLHIRDYDLTIIGML